MDINDIKIGTEASFIGSFEKGISSIKRIEAIGYDSIWFADHLMGWTPDSIWTPELISAAEFQKSPHIFHDAFSVMAVAAWNTNQIKMGTSVTETFRRHPAVLAQTLLTQDHISKGRVILGIGAGEGENVIPYGIKWESPAKRLEEAIKIIKLLWRSDKKVSYDGKFWKLKDAVLSLKPYEENKYPPIWTAAHGPKMLDITGRLADGWLPAYSDPTSYKERLNKIKNSAKKAGRNPEDITPGLFTYLIIDEDHNVCDELLNSAVVKNQMLTMPPSLYEEYGVKHPFGDNFYGLLDYIPTRYDQNTILEAIDKIPAEMCGDNILHGTSDEVISKIEKYAKAGLKHIVFYNTTYLADITKIKSSFSSMKKVLNYFKSE
ncbi:MAG: LLM class flavin-dependent oxidoreductase [Promethearchaeota archaeon]|nr:MAG: LLM class flavin-dependent oxidoreductase [Candidatus Lokiarchaeota archaeon]